MIPRTMHRVQSIVLPVLRAELTPLWPGLDCVSWNKDVDYRAFPILQVRRLGGLARDIRHIDRAVIELTAHTRADLPTTENLLLDGMTVLYDMVDNQTVTAAGSLSSIFVTMGPTQFDGIYDDSWRVQSLIQLGIRPPRA